MCGSFREEPSGVVTMTMGTGNLRCPSKKDKNGFVGWKRSLRLRQVHARGKDLEGSEFWGSTTMVPCLWWSGNGFANDR